mmetsp:Transcript_2699/g.6166  ORF Transcript_2699/g.6166 Transcript_2699/m.6166 type:complete len:305 (+) Transcript_2699:124-1038(+)
MGEEGKSPRSSGGRRSSRRSRLNAMNLLNIGYCFLSTLFNVGIGLCGMFGLPTYADQSVHYPTIISPSPYFIVVIWAVIFASQGIFTIFQVTPVLRARPQVQDGVKYYYGLASFLQVLYTLTYNTDMMAISVFIAFGVVASLRSLVQSQNVAQADNTWAEYWLLRFPFHLHLGWMYYVFLLTLQNTFVYLNVNNYVQMISGGISIALIITLSLYHLFWANKPLRIVPPVLLYAAAGILLEKLMPTNYLVQASFHNHTLFIFKVTTLATVVILSILNTIVACRTCRRRGSNDNEEGTDYVNADMV